ncbi:hypothetical protein EJB05_01279, partial [Eragrostis curvula]
GRAWQPAALPPLQPDPTPTEQQNRAPASVLSPNLAHFAAPRSLRPQPSSRSSPWTPELEARRSAASLQLDPLKLRCDVLFEVPEHLFVAAVSFAGNRFVFLVNLSSPDVDFSAKFLVDGNDIVLSAGVMPWDVQVPEGWTAHWESDQPPQ